MDSCSAWAAKDISNEQDFHALQTPSSWTAKTLAR
jgi:hypothetical protein